ncbi:polyketide synthase dehydratase domain-containing protein, partial [Streptomyces sp. DSM 44915]
TGLVELALTAGDHIGSPTLAELMLHTPLTLTPHTTTDIQLRIQEPDPTNHERTLTIHSRPTPDTDWTQHATGTLTPHQPDHTEDP